MMRNKKILYSILMCILAAITSFSCKKKTQTSSIVFTNDTYTPVHIDVNGNAQTIPVGGAATYYGNTGSAANVTATTSGSTSSGTQVGDLISWSFTDYFPNDGGAAASDPLDVDASYFYLYVINNSGLSATSLIVNVSLASQTTDNVVVPSDGNTYGIGYYLGYSNTQVEAMLSNNTSWTSSALYIPNTNNASATVTIP